MFIIGQQSNAEWTWRHKEDSRGGQILPLRPLFQYGNESTHLCLRGGGLFDIIRISAPVVELVDTLAWGASGYSNGCASSSLVGRTIIRVRIAYLGDFSFFARSITALKRRNPPSRWFYSRIITAQGKQKIPIWTILSFDNFGRASKYLTRNFK